MIKVALKPKLQNDVLDPKNISYVNEFILLENLTTRLVSIDQSGSPQLSLASKIERISDVEYSFEIKPLKFSNGDLITLGDVKESIERVISSGSTHIALKDYFSSIEIKESRIIIHLKRPTKSLFYYLSLPDLGILHVSQYSKSGLVSDDFKITSGPFSLEYEKKNMVLKKNKNYILGTIDYPEKVTFVNPFENDITELILKDSIDIGQISLNDFFKNKDKLALKRNFRSLGIPSDALTYIFFNKKSTNLSIHQRRYLSYLIKKHFKVPNDLSNIAIRSYQYFPPESEAFIGEQELFGEDFVPVSMPPEITIHTYTTSFNVTIEPLVRSLESIPGIKLKILADIDPARYDEMIIEKKVDVFLTIMSTDYRMPVEAINFEYFSPYARFKDHSGNIKKWFDKYQATTNQVEERELLKAISVQMNKDHDFIPLFHSTIPVFYKSSRIDLHGLHHRYIMNFWRFKTI